MQSNNLIFKAVTMLIFIIGVVAFNNIQVGSQTLSKDKKN